MITCRLAIGEELKHPLDFLMASFETDSRLSSSLQLAEVNTVHPYSILNLINDL